MANSFGQLFRVTTFGESHGGGIGVVIDGCPPKIDIIAYVDQTHEVMEKVERSTVKKKNVDENIVRCPDPAAAGEMITLIEKAREEGDSLGGTIECVVRNAPAGLGEPVFDKLEADLAKAMLSLPATKGFEIGSGFSATRMRGSEHNDAFEMRGGKVRTSTNHSGGIQGGISNGEE